MAERDEDHEDGLEACSIYMGKDLTFSQRKIAFSI